MGSVGKSLGSVASFIANPIGAISTGNVVGQIGDKILGGGLAPQYTDTDALQGIANQQLAGARDVQGQLSGLAQQRTDFGQALANQALGKSPSIADAQLKMAMDRNLSQQIAAAKANRAVNPALQARQINQAAAQGAQATAQQSAVNKLAEQQQAQQMFGNYLGQQQQAGANFLQGAGQSQSGVMNNQFANQQRGINMIQGAAQAGAMAFGASDASLKTLVKKYSQGGMVKPAKKYAAGGMVPDAGAGSFLSAMKSLDLGGSQQPQGIVDVTGGQMLAQNNSNFGKDFGSALAKIIKGKAPTEGGLEHLAGRNAGNVALGAAPVGGTLMRADGGYVQGPEISAADSEVNDVVPALLSGGEVVVPKTVVQKGSKAAAKFVAKEKAKHGQSGGKMADGGKVADKAKDQFDPRSFLNALQATSFEYKKGAKNIKGAGEGRYLGIMAQDLENAGPVGRSMVQQTPEGKKVDFGKGFGAILASQAALNERLAAIESKWGKKGSK